MAAIRNISEHKLFVRVIDRAVDVDEQVDVPDTVFAEHEWPDTLWDVVDRGKAVFDPSKKTVAQVLAHLDRADEDERDRVLTAERNGQARKGILGDDAGVI